MDVELNRKCRYVCNVDQHTHKLKLNTYKILNYLINNNLILNSIYKLIVLFVDINVYTSNYVHVLHL